MDKQELKTLLDNVVRPISKIESDLKMPINTLQKATTGERRLPKKWALLLKEYVAKKRYLSAEILEKNSEKLDVCCAPEKEGIKKEPQKISYLQQLYNRKMGIR